jgi:hypothetical protein
MARVKAVSSALCINRVTDGGLHAAATWGRSPTCRFTPRRPKEIEVRNVVDATHRAIWRARLLSQVLTPNVFAGVPIERLGRVASPHLVAPNIVFDIGGNKYRLIAEMNFMRRVLFIRSIMTHNEYAKGTWRF